MANINIRTPRFYCDYINFVDSRDPAGGHYGISTSANQIDVVSGNSVANLFDMKPLNQVEFNTTGDPDGAVNLWFDLKTAAFNVDFVAILNHNMHVADAKVRIASDDHATDKDEIIAIDFGSASNTANVSARLGVEAVDDNLAQADDTDSWGRGHTIIEFTEVADRFWGIQFEGMVSQTDLGANNGTFDADTNLKIGCILLGQYYDMPNSPDLSVKRSIAFDAVNMQESLGGQRYATMTNSGRQNISGSNKSPFHTYYNAFGAYGGRMTYDMKFSYLASTDVMPDSYHQFQNADEAVVEDLWNKTNGRHIPFIFTQNSGSTDYSDYLFARFAQDSLAMTQVAPDVFDVSMKIEEEF